MGYRVIMASAVTNFHDNRYLIRPPIRGAVLITGAPSGQTWTVQGEGGRPVVLDAVPEGDTLTAEAAPVETP
jgi:hypothetical protein